LRKNEEAHDARVELFALQMAVQREIDKPADFRATEAYYDLKESFRRQQNMIIGESVLLVLSLFGGLFLLFRSLRKEISAAEQQRNFLLSITHELKSPLAGIRLILETFQKRRELKPEIQQKLSTNALVETDRLTSLVNDLLLSAKLEQAYQINEEKIDLGGLIHEAADTVFTKFYRIGNEDTRTTKGTGLGLFIVKQLVEKHGGQLELLNNEPRGTTFRIYLPTA